MTKTFQLVLMFKRLGERMRALKRTLWRLTARDLPCVMFLLVIAAVLRMPMIDHPQVTQFDEVTYANYAMHLIDERPFVDIHPPLARILFAEVARTAEPFSTRFINMKFGQPPGDFPLARERAFVALFGIILPLLIYALARELGYSARTSLLVGLFAATDNALIIYSRTMLPDTLLLCFEFLALWLALLGAKKETTREHALFVIGCGIAIGAALSIKWTAGAMLLLIALLFALYRRYNAILATAAIALLVYVCIFCAALLFYFPMGGTSSNFANDADTSSMWVAHLTFPKISTLTEALAFLPQLHTVMISANGDPRLLDSTLRAQGAYSWPIARNRIIFWPKEIEANNPVIALTGNTALWTMSFFVLLFDLFWIAFRMVRTRKFPIGRNEAILLIGYFLNYLPFFFIHRPLYLYHYFTALLLLLLLLPVVTMRIVACLECTTDDRLFARVFVALAAVLIFINFIVLLPSTYGF